MTHRRRSTPARHARTNRRVRPALDQPITTPTALGHRLWLRAWTLVTVGCVRVAEGFTASWLDWLIYWPGLAFALTRTGQSIRIAVRAVRTLTGRIQRSTVASVHRVGQWPLSQWLRRTTPPILRRTGRALRWLAVRAGRVTRGIAVRVWRWAEPSLRDAAGWLTHTAPRLLVRLLRKGIIRLARWLPGAVIRLVGYASIGIGWCAVRLVTYCVAYPEYAPMIREAREDDWPRRAYALTQQWRRAALRRCGFFLAVGLLGWLGWSVAIEHYGTRARLVILTVAVVGFAVVGRAVRPPTHSEDTPPGEAEVPENAPYPIADAHTRAEAADCVARALTAENIALRMTGEAQRTGWGWTVPVILRTGTPAAIVAKTGELETHLDLPAGGVLATPDRSRRARVVLRLAQSDPFANLGYAPHRPPASLSITHRVVIGRRIDGEHLGVPLLGVHGVVVGSPGAGKSSTLLTLGDAVTVCADAVLWDLDPAGDGLRALGPAVGRRERDTAGIEAALADALALAEVRPRMLTDLGMGAAWEPSPERPAVVVMVDEYPRLSAHAKQLAVQILRVGRKARVTLILAATEATSDALGAAIADTTALKILHACRFQDIQLVLGPQMGAEGWRPDRLHPATADDPGDAGRCYVATAGHREPVLSKIAPVDLDRAGNQGAHRAAFGLPRIDTGSWNRARTRRVADRVTESGGRADRSPIGGGGSTDRRAEVDYQGVTDVIAAFGTDRRLWTEELVTRLAALDERYGGWTGEGLAALLRPLGVAPKGIKRAGINRNGYDRDAITTAFQAWHDGGDR